MRDPQLAAWMISQRVHIDRLVAIRLGPAAPGALASNEMHGAGGIEAAPQD